LTSSTVPLTDFLNSFGSSWSDGC